MKKILVILVLISTFLTVGCKDATRAQFNALGKRHNITLYANDGKVIKSWVSTGNVNNQANSDGWYFEDEKTGRLVEVTGTLIIEVIP